MADTTATKQKLRRYISEVSRRAFDRQVELDTQFVPRGTGIHSDSSPRLAETRQVTRTAFGGTITYPTMNANYQEEGTQPHPIVARVGRALVFVWPAGPPELASPRGSSRFAFRSVMHPGSTINVGWFTKRANAVQWSRSVSGAASQVTF